MSDHAAFRLRPYSNRATFRAACRSGSTTSYTVPLEHPAAAPTADSDAP
jgi:hypothetical protein